MCAHHCKIRHFWYFWGLCLHPRKPPVHTSVHTFPRAGGSRRVGGLLDKAGRRQLRDVGNVVVGEAAATAQCQHGGDALQKNVALLDRQHARRVHDDLKLIVGQANHVPEDNPERPFAENTGRDNFAPCPADTGGDALDLCQEL